DLVDGPVGGARLLHTLLFSASLLVLVMLATRRHRRARRRWLALPIGTFLHLVLDGMWTRTHTFWWPFFGARLHDRLPALAHGPTHRSPARGDARRPPSDACSVAPSS